MDIFQKYIKILESKRTKTPKITWADVIDATASEAAKKLGLFLKTTGGIFGLGCQHFFSFYRSDERDEHGNFKHENFVKSVCCYFDYEKDDKGKVTKAWFSYDTDEIETIYPVGSIGYYNGFGHKQRVLPVDVDAFIQELNLKAA